MVSVRKPSEKYTLSEKIIYFLISLWAILSLYSWANNICLYVFLPLSFVLVLSQNRDIYETNRFLKLLFVLYFWFLISSFFSVDVNESFLQVKRTVATFLLCTVFASIGEKRPVVGYVIYLLFFIALLYYAYFNILSIIDVSEERMQDDNVNANMFAYYTSFTTFALFILSYCSRREKSIVKESDIDSKMAFEPNKYNTFQIKVDNGVLSLSAGNKELSTLFSCEYIPQKTFSAGIVAGKNKISIKRIEFKSIPDKRVSNKTSYTQADVEQAVKNTGNDFYVGFWRYFDRNTDDSRFELGGKYTIALVPTDSGYDILYISGANRFSSYWSPYMKKGALVRTPFYNQYEIHWFTADKNLYFDECYASVSEDILTLHFPIQQSTVRFYRFTPSSENP